jgi:catechol 2,3-dioxygenase-like lactoylglutathione lyase family enzyme
MLQTNAAFSTFAVPDLDAARRFYGQTLGLKVHDQPEMGVMEIQVGDSQPVTVYPKPDFRPATYTVLNFLVDDIDRAVSDLNANGVRMERYDQPDMQPDDKGIVRNGQGPAIAWFTDPAGNILSLMESDRRASH